MACAGVSGCRWLLSAAAAVSARRGVTARRRQGGAASLPPLTTDIHSDIRRGQYARLTPEDVAAFVGICGSENVLTDADEVQSFNIDWLRICRGQGQLVLKPSTVSQVADVLRHCSGRRLAVVPQGGNTGLVGGSVPLYDEIVLSTGRMSRVLQVDETSGCVVAEAGCVLEQLDAKVAEHGLVVPLDLGAKGSCQIGGNVATNAGGLRLLRYGSLRGSVVGLEAVLPSGEVLDCLTQLRKDNTGYDIKQLFIGSEGTLGVITKVAIACPSRPKSQQLALLACDSFGAVLRTFRLARERLGEVLSAFEFMDNESAAVVRQNVGLANPLGHEHPFYVLTETSGSNEAHDKEKLEQYLESVMSDGSVVDGTVAQDTQQFRQLWSLRERIVEALLADGYEYKYDVSLHQSQIYELVEHMRLRLGDSVIRTSGYGHLGDGNLHLNFTTRHFDADVYRRIEPHVFEFVRDRRGSVSAEHGLGIKKAEYIRYSKSELAVQLMASVKRLFDPNGIMNPYKMLPRDVW